MTDTLDKMMYWYFRLEGLVRPIVTSYNFKVKREGIDSIEIVFDFLNNYKKNVDKAIGYSFEEDSELALRDSLHELTDDIFCQGSLITAMCLLDTSDKYIAKLDSIASDLDNLFISPLEEDFFPPNFSDYYV